CGPGAGARHLPRPPDLGLRIRPPPPRCPLFPYTTLFRSAPVAWSRARPVRDRHTRDCRRSPAEASACRDPPAPHRDRPIPRRRRSEEHTSELQSRENLVCRLLLEKKKTPDSPASDGNASTPPADRSALCDTLATRAVRARPDRAPPSSRLTPGLRRHGRPHRLRPP